MKEKNKRLYLFALSCIVILAIGLRLYHISAPIADWHSWRQADTASVARNFIKFGIDPTHPRYDDVSNIQSGKDNPMGYRMVEFPFYQWIAVVLYRTFPAVSLEIYLRLINIFATAGSVVCIGFLLSQYIHPVAGIMGAMLYATLPFSVYYGRTILPDTFMVFWALLSLVFATLLEKDKRTGVFIVLAAISGSIALLVKPTAAFLLLPIPYIIFRSLIRLPARHRLAQAIAGGFAYSLISIIPLILWRVWIGQYPEGIPLSQWLLNNADIRLKGAWFYWIFARRVGELILGYWGLIPFGIGMIVRIANKNGLFSIFWIIGALLYVIIFAGGNVQHDYYQILLIPIIVWFTAKGFWALIQSWEHVVRVRSILLAVVCYVFMLAFSWYTVRTYYWINRPEIIEAGHASDRLLPKDAKVIAPYNGDTTFLYHTNRQGWPIGFEIERKIQQGATHYVTVYPTDPEAIVLKDRYLPIVQNEKYMIIDLTKKK